MMVRTINAIKVSQGKTLYFNNKKDIIHQSSCTNSPQQNGMVERKHRYLLEVSRAFYFQSKVPISFWGDCVESAVHAINKMPLNIFNNITPYGRLYQKKPSYDMIRSFKCLHYASTFDKERTKFERRAQPSVFIEYSKIQKAYKLYSLER